MGRAHVGLDRRHVLAGVIPGLLIGLSQMVTTYVYARRHSYPIHARSSLAELAGALAGATLALMTPLIIIGGIVVGGIVGGVFTPTEASVVAVLYSLVLGTLVYRTVGPSKLAHVLYDTGRFAAIALFCIGTASAFGWLLAYFTIPTLLIAGFEGLGLGSVGFGLLVAAAFLVIGRFIDAIPAIIILGTVLFPVAQHVGMHPIRFALIGVISLAFGLVTPPYGLCLPIACAIGEIRVAAALRDVAVILAPMLLVLLVVILLPDLVLFLPRRIMPRFVD